MTTDISTILFWANILTEACYVGTLFQSCQNHLLYPTLQIHLSSLQSKSLTVSKNCSHILTSLSVTRPKFGRKHTWKKWNPNKLGTHNLNNTPPIHFQVHLHVVCQNQALAAWFFIYSLKLIPHMSHLIMRFQPLCPALLYLNNTLPPHFQVPPHVIRWNCALVARVFIFYNNSFICMYINLVFNITCIKFKA